MLIEISPAAEEWFLTLEYLDIASAIGASWWFPFIETIHVLAAVFMAGMLLMVDIRLIGLAAKRYSASLIMRQQLPWVWGAFIVAAISGGLMFITNALAYASNLAMQLKIIFIVLAGCNTFFLHIVLKRLPVKDISMQKNDKQKETAFGWEKILGGVSLGIWISVIVAGRWVGHIS